MAVKDNLVPKCCVCGLTPYKGIHGGILIGKRFLCTSCEAAIVRLSIDDENYHFYLDGVKRIWA